MPARSLVLGLVLCAVSMYAQNNLPKTGRLARPVASLEHSRLNLTDSNLTSGLASGTDSISVLAIMVDFKAEASNLTTGDGKFQLAATAQTMIDPPPHDSAYFAAKLEFLSNYYRRVSNGKVIVRGDVFGRVITLPKSMSSYSPAKDGSNDKPLANLVVESWHVADSLYPAIQFNKYQAFVVFHAGVGRDLDLVSALGYDPTPFDIPSLTFSLGALRKYLGNESYAGVPVDGGTYLITNTMLLPETETRTLPSATGVDTLYGSINGLLANSFGSYLGLPDLFDTKTGRSGIGNFGLMDVAGSISFFAGLFPPEPSAWEKIFLGWMTPITIGPGTSTLTVPAVGLKNGRDTVYKIPISDREYFLLENRSRDPRGTGVRLTVRRNLSDFTMTFPTDTGGFNLDDVGLINGSVIDVDGFDWALPGLTSQGDVYAGGGILIWHIDENVIAHGLSDNTVNADPSHPGVYLKEADGSRDIGRSYDPYSDPGAGTELGWPLDFWFKGNSSDVYTNVFDKESHPDSRSHSGALSLVTVRGFSVRSPRMTATVEIGDNLFHRLPAFSKTIPSANAATPVTVTGTSILLGVDGAIHAFAMDGSSRTKDTMGLLAEKGGTFSLAAKDVGSALFVAGAQDSTLSIINATDTNADGVIDNVQTVTAPLGDRASTPPMVADLSVVPSVAVGTARGTVCVFAQTGTLQKKMVVSTVPVTSLAQLPTAALSKPGELFFACGGHLHSELGSVSLEDSTLPWILAAAASRSGNFVVAAQCGGLRILAYSRDLGKRLFDLRLNGAGVSALSVADIDRDGEKEIIATSGDLLYALNRMGSVLSGFPVKAPAGEWYVGDGLVADLDGDGTVEIVHCLSSGNLVAYGRDGRIVAGFPVQLTSGGEASIAIFRSRAGQIGIAALTSTGTLQALELAKPFVPANIVWSQHLGDASHANVDGSSGGTTPAAQEFLPRSRVYNWPNPVYGSSTYIRYYTDEDAAIKITILDLSGRKVTELTASARGGLDGEVPWDVSNVQSGVYLARVEASGSTRTEVVTIKIAIVK
jgi:hypothetical protein